MKHLYALIFILVTLNVSASGWIQKADFGGTARHRTTMLALGNKVYLGLGHYNGAGINVLFDDWWEYDPATNAWSQKADYLGGICYHAAAFSINDIGYVGTGRVSVSGNTLVQDFFKYDPQTNTWTQLSDFPGVGRRGAVGFSIANYGFIGSGTNASDFYRYEPATDTWIQVASLPNGSRISAVGFELGGKGYVGTGYSYNVGWSTTDFYEYDPIFNTWTQIGDVGTIPRMEASGFALNGRGYVLTGDNISSGTNYKDMWELDPTSGTWTQIENFDGTARRYLSSVALNGYAYCGMGTNGTNFKDFWLFDQTLSLIERSLEDITLSAFPNPSFNVATINVSWDQQVPIEQMTLRVTALTGERVYDEPLKNGDNPIDVSTYPSGQYIYSIVYSDRAIKSGNLVVL